DTRTSDSVCRSAPSSRPVPTFLGKDRDRGGKLPEFAERRSDHRAEARSHDGQSERAAARVGNGSEILHVYIKTVYIKTIVARSCWRLLASSPPARRPDLTVMCLTRGAKSVAETVSSLRMPVELRALASTSSRPNEGRTLQASIAAPESP